ncbi:MAG: hypothetical protein KME54_00350 [Tolypothrix brevis GSE-NOS-MK-07-07A]|jgi:hypothetical protein|nr:hypothetical protein [Tolypothrix brevis GSE-NOS-MK-07-07A]
MRQIYLALKTEILKTGLQTAVTVPHKPAIRCKLLLAHEDGLCLFSPKL